MTIQAARPAARDQMQRAPGRALPLLLIGGVCGLAWAAGLRGFMAQVSGSDSQVTSTGTFGWILLPSLVVGVLLGLAEHIRRTGGRRHWRWLALSPRLFASVLAPGTADPANLFAGGPGGGALEVPLFGMAGGYAIASRGRRWARAVCPSLALVPIPTWVIVGNADGADVTASEAWIAVHVWSLLAVLAITSAIPHRPIAEPPVGIS